MELVVVEGVGELAHPGREQIWYPCHLAIGHDIPPWLSTQVGQGQVVFEAYEAAQASHAVVEGLNRARVRPDDVMRAVGAWAVRNGVDIRIDQTG